MLLNKIIIISLMTGSAFLFDGCPGQAGDVPTPPKPTPVVTGTDQCGAAEQNLHNLCNMDPVKNNYCCQVVAPTKKGKSYTQFCQEKQNQGIFLNPKCVSGVTSCDQIDPCTNSK